MARTEAGGIWGPGEGRSKTCARRQVCTFPGISFFFFFLSPKERLSLLWWEWFLEIVRFLSSRGVVLSL